jgi:rare lipoprotein A
MLTINKYDFGWLSPSDNRPSVGRAASPGNRYCQVATIGEGALSSIGLIRKTKNHLIKTKSILLVTIVILCVGCASTARYGNTAENIEISSSIASFRQTGMASYYAKEFDGRTTASGERYDMNALTAAHQILPFKTRVRVTNLSNNRSVVVRINDRGPFTKRRIIDLSFAAAEKIGLVEAGTTKVEIEVVDNK